MCPNDIKGCEKHFNYENEALFVWTKGTCVADEVFCQFFACRGKREIYFNTFCHEMTEGYKDSYTTSKPFLSCKTFISCMMSWIINQGIDYRAVESICTFCGHYPEVLSCDGVAVGVKLKYLTRLPNITAPEKQEIKKSVHRRNDRVFITGQEKRDIEHRQFLVQFCNSIIAIGKKSSKQ